MPTKTAVYAGSFDIPTFGHLFVIEEGARLFDRLIVAITYNSQKGGGTCGLSERKAMLAEIIRHLPNVEVESFEGQLTVRWAERQGAGFLLRGMRNGDDFEKERTVCRTNRQLAPVIGTCFVIPPPELAEVSSSMVRELMKCQGWETDIGHFVPEPVQAHLIERFSRRLRFGQWCRMWRELGARSATMAGLLKRYDDLAARYGGAFDAPRAYHNLDHVFAMLDRLEEVRDRLHEPAMVQLAAWYHDIVYVPDERQNEAWSAQEMAQAVGDLVKGGMSDFGGLVEDMIRATAHDGNWPEHLPDTAYLLDADLVTLGLPRDEFDKVRGLIREEHSAANDLRYAMGTIGFCEKMLSREPIFLTEHFRDKYEASARNNLKRLRCQMLEILDRSYVCVPGG